jgi:hypothetical protein
LLDKVSNIDIFDAKTELIRGKMQNFKLEPFFEPAPPRMSRLFGYKGSYRWIAFYWNGHGKGPRFPWHFDGHTVGAVNRSVWEAFMNHRLVLAYNYHRKDGYATMRFQFGSDRFNASHWLLLDRQGRSLYAAPESEAARFITRFRDQRPAGGAQRCTETALEAQSRKAVASRQDGVMKGISDMVSWLDRRVDILATSGKWPFFF